MIGEVRGATVLGEDVYVGYYALVGAGSAVGQGTVIDDFSVIECGVSLGEKTLVIYRAHICNDAQIGHDCVIGGLIAERVLVGDRSRVFGRIVHSQRDPSRPWDADDSEEPSAIIGDDVFVGFNAVVAGQVNIGPGAYVCAGATVTRDVPAWHVAYGVNKHTSYRAPFCDGARPTTGGR